MKILARGSRYSPPSLQTKALTPSAIAYDYHASLKKLDYLAVIRASTPGQNTQTTGARS
jgi:hypothetical protein